MHGLLPDSRKELGVGGNAELHFRASILSERAPKSAVSWSLAAALSIASRLEAASGRICEHCLVEVAVRLS